MNQDTLLSRRKNIAMVVRLIAAARSSENASDFFGEAIVQLLGCNRTDARCSDIIQRYGKVTAGELAKRANLTTGAVTTVIDRLEKAGIARRVRDKTDRRKVYVELSDFTNTINEILFDRVGEVYGKAMGNVSCDELRIISQYLEFSQRLNSQYAQILQQNLPKNNASRKQRLEAAQKFSTERDKISKQLIASWGEEPTEQPAIGEYLGFEELLKKAGES